VSVTLAEALATGRGNERSFLCPAHQASHETASVNVLKGVWYCYSCHAHGTTDDHVPSVEEALSVLAGTAPPRIMPEAWLDIFDADHSSGYWVRRYGLDVALANRCGTDPETGAPTYPVRDAEGRLLGVVTRHEDTEPKYRYPWNVSTSRTLYGRLRACDVLILVEGASDVMAIEEPGLPPDWVVGGTFGAGVHAPQVELIARLNPKVVLLAFDDDEAGLAAIERAQETVADVAPALSHHWRKMNVKDAGAGPAANRIPALVDTLNEHGFGRYAREAIA
jgi:hypothetical protein